MNIDVATCLNCVYFAYIALIKSIKCIPRMYWVGRNNRKKKSKKSQEKKTPARIKIRNIKWVLLVICTLTVMYYTTSLLFSSSAFFNIYIWIKFSIIPFIPLSFFFMLKSEFWFSQSWPLGLQTHQQRWCDCLHRPRRLPGKPISHMSHKRSS